MTIPPWCREKVMVYYYYMDGAVREVNADDTALLADSEKLCRLVSEFGRVFESRKLRVNVGKCKVRCSRYGNEGPTHVIVNGEP